MLTLQFENRLASFDILLGNRLLFVTTNQVGLNQFAARQVRDLLDAFGIQNVVRIEFLERSLLQVVDRTVIQAITVEIGTDHLQDLFLEAVSRVVKLDKVKVLTDRLQSLGELGVEQLHQTRLLRSSLASQGLSHERHVLGRLINSDEESHLNVSANVVAADQALLSLPEDLDPFDRDLHPLPEVNHRDDKHSAETDSSPTHAVADDRLTLLDLLVELRCQRHECDGNDAHNHHRP